MTDNPSPGAPGETGGSQNVSHSDRLSGGGEMGAHPRLRLVEDLPRLCGELAAKLRSAVSILLPSKAQIVLFWDVIC
ncbi:MAG: hypothetical protein M3O07_10650 [Pseudomonadota bacterium]|nr:hypothetical protein [Pseudomonadota bacterium]